MTFVHDLTLLLLYYRVETTVQYTVLFVLLRTVRSVKSNAISVHILLSDYYLTPCIVVLIFKYITVSALRR